MYTQRITMQQQEREIQRGFWLYAGMQTRGVIIKAINYDYYHELEKPGGFFDLGGEVPVLNEHGEMYLIEWTDASFTQQESLTAGCLDFTETVALANSIVGQAIEWLPIK
jgi:hypothetical protein